MYWPTPESGNKTFIEIFYWWGVILWIGWTSRERRWRWNGHVGIWSFQCGKRRFSDKGRLGCCPGQCERTITCVWACRSLKSLCFCCRDRIGTFWWFVRLRLRSMVNKNLMRNSDAHLLAHMGLRPFDIANQLLNMHERVHCRWSIVIDVKRHQVGMTCRHRARYRSNGYFHSRRRCCGSCHRQYKEERAAWHIIVTGVFITCSTLTSNLNVWTFELWR